MTGKVRTRIAPSPTGFLHLGTARTALYSWAYARHHGGEFVLRIEDTDVARSTQDSTDQILASMHWLGLDYDEGPIYQMQRLERYREVIAQMLAAGTAYHCYCTPAELDEMREAQRARGEKTLYDRRWRPEPGKVLPPVPEGVPPVVRFCNPPEGDVTWNDLVKGEITINNREIDDLIILRPDGVPTYNFAVVVDDWDMNITHVFRGDEHINNTPWQINIFRALGAQLPEFGHVPVILGDDGQKLSKRRGAVSVTAYEDNGYLPEAMLNYLARLGWSHGDDELFTREQMVSWFDGSHLSKSPAQWDAAKLAWVNAQYIKAKSGDELAPLVQGPLRYHGGIGRLGCGVLCGHQRERCRSRAAHH
jgi:glutamyl-tRNA synthetase